MTTHWAYIWPAYGISLIVLSALSFYLWRRSRVLQRKLTELESRLDC